MGNFREQLEFGKVGESKIARWLRARGNTVLPVYEKLDDDKIGPRLYLPESEAIAPDILTWKGCTMSWIEAKHKTVFTWYRIRQKWQTGIDLRHYKDYLKIAKLKNSWPVWLLFLHENDEPDEIDIPYCPPKCPIGLYGGNLLALEKTVDHTDMRWGKSGMIYWNEEDLIKIATIKELNSALGIEEGTFDTGVSVKEARIGQGALFE